MSKDEESIDLMKKSLVERYYNLENDITLYVDFPITASKIIEILGNKKVFIFNNKFYCETSQKGSNTDISIKITYSQGFKIFRAFLDPRLISKSSEQDKLVYDKIYDICYKIIRPDMSDYEKELAVHNYLILTSSYDYINYKHNTIPSVSYTPYGLFFENKAVCSAYAEVFMIFMILAQIECYFVVGTLINSLDNADCLGETNGHAWNIVKINNQYYHVDVTLDSPIPYVIGKVNYTYFNVTDEFMDKTHNWKLNEYPICDTTEYNYYNVLRNKK